MEIVRPLITLAVLFLLFVFIALQHVGVLQVCRGVSPYGANDVQCFYYFGK